MAALWKKQIPIPDDKQGRVLEFALTFHKGGTNYATYKQIPRSYRLNVVPVKIRNEGSVSIREFGAFTGFNATILEVNRQSKKRLQTAISTVESKLIEYYNYWNEHHNTERKDDAEKETMAEHGSSD